MRHVNQVYLEVPVVIYKCTDPEFDTLSGWIHASVQTGHSRPQKCHSGRKVLGELTTAPRRRAKMPLIRLQQPNQQKRELEKSKGRVTPSCVSLGLS